MMRKQGVLIPVTHIREFLPLHVADPSYISSSSRLADIVSTLALFLFIDSLDPTQGGTWKGQFTEGLLILTFKVLSQ